MDSRGHLLLSFTFHKSAMSVVFFPLHSSKNGCTLRDTCCIFLSCRSECYALSIVKLDLRILFNSGKILSCWDPYGESQGC